MIEKIKWFFRWLTLLLTLGATVFTVMTWEWSAGWYLAALTNGGIYSHSIAMLMGWWRPSK